MNRTTEQINTYEKKRIRDEINTQVEEFLKKGGRIDVLHCRQSGNNKIGAVWHSQDELPLLSD